MVNRADKSRSLHDVAAHRTSAAATPCVRAPRLVAAGILPIVAVVGVLFASARGQEGVIDREYPLKAAFLYNFGKYVDWPDDYHVSDAQGRTVFVIGVVGRNPFGDALDAIAKAKTLKERPIVVSQIARAADFENCHILFVPSGANAQLVGDVLARAQKFPVLVVGEEEGFAQAKGTVNFYIEENRVKFEINEERAEQLGLKLSSKLLQLGKMVRSP